MAIAGCSLLGSGILKADYIIIVLGCIIRSLADSCNCLSYC
ncbi:MAG: hypothetical protein ABR969_06230 [Sedimentisphaerales bacterium]